MSEVQNWGKMSAVPDRGRHSPLALLRGLYPLLDGKKKKLQFLLCTYATTVPVASSSVFNQVWKSYQDWQCIFFNLPEQHCCFFLFISSFNCLTSDKSFSTDRSLTSTVEHIFCKEKSI